MRYTLFVFLLLSATAHAKCGSDGIGIQPGVLTELPERPIILVRGFARDQATVRGLKGASLRAGKHQVALERVTVNEGAFALTQVVFRAAEPLKAGRNYTLWLHGKTKLWRPTWWHEGGNRFYSWRVATAPIQGPEWTAKPSLGAGSVQQFGCGPAVNQTVKLPFTGQGLVQVDIDGPDGKQSWLMPLPKGDALDLGHGMCSGEFEVGTAGSYQAALRLVDWSGEAQGEAHTVSCGAVRE